MYPDYDYYGYETMEFLEEFGFAFLGVLLGILLITLVISIVMYILQSLGIYAIAKRRGIKNAWLAWIPVGYYWIVGSIADQYQYVAKGKVKNKRKIMLCLSIATMCLGLITNLITVIVTVAAEDASGAIAVSSMISAFQSLLNAGIAITLLVFWHMSLYDLYSSCNPENNVLFLVLGIFFGVTIPFFIFFNRKKDGGMPPRRPEPQAYIPPQEPWNNPDMQ